LPIIGFLTSLSSTSIALRAPSVRQGLGEAGFVEGRNVVIEYRAAEGQYDRLPSLAADLVGRKVDVIFAYGGSGPAKAATASIPIVFVSAADPIEAGIVTSLNRPGGNVTGVSLLGSALETKRLGLLSEIVPGTAAIAALVNPQFPDIDFQLRALQDAAGAIKRQVIFLRASTEPELVSAFADALKQGAAALLVTQDALFYDRRELLVALAAQYKLPAIYPQREIAEMGGLISYDTNFSDQFRQAGIYLGRILKGASPADLPVVQPTKFDIVINLKTAKTLGLAIPESFLVRADEVIE
jgi:putative tryptophan/tyrosine transport system substrate-binding protein